MCCRPSSPKALKPFIDTVVTFGAGHFYVSQSDKGGLVFGGDIDGYNSYAQRGNLPVVEDVMEARLALMPGARPRAACCAHWGGIMDMSMDGSPIIDRTPLAEHLSQLRLVLWRLQGDAGLRLVLRAPHRQGRAASRSPRHSGSTASHAAALIDEKGEGAQPNLH